MEKVTIDLGWRKTTGCYHKNGGGFVEETAQVRITAYIGENAKVSGNAIVSGNAEVSGNAKATSIVYTLISSFYNITITDNHVRIGCEQWAQKKALQITATQAQKKYKVDPKIYEIIKAIITNLVKLKEIK